MDERPAGHRVLYRRVEYRSDRSEPANRFVLVDRELIVGEKRSVKTVRVDHRASDQDPDEGDRSAQRRSFTSRRISAGPLPHDLVMSIPGSQSLQQSVATTFRNTEEGSVDGLKPICLHREAMTTKM